MAVYKLQSTSLADDIQHQRENSTENPKTVKRKIKSTYEVIDEWFDSLCESLVHDHDKWNEVHNLITNELVKHPKQREVVFLAYTEKQTEHADLWPWMKGVSFSHVYDYIRLYPRIKRLPHDCYMSDFTIVLQICDYNIRSIIMSATLNRDCECCSIL